MSNETEKIRRENSLDTFQTEFNTYLQSRLEGFNVPAHIIMEIAGYAAIRGKILACDEVDKAFRYWKRQQKLTFKRRRTNFESEGQNDS